MTAVPPDGDLSGQILDDRYKVIGPIGEGAMGSVYRAERMQLGRIVAVKVMNERLPDEMSSRRRFEREAMAMAKLEHPHCASVLDVGVHNGRPYVVMDFVSGQNLTELVGRGPVPIARAVEIMRQVLSGLAHAHEHGVVHRDIKPGNLVLSQKSGLGDHVKILDFGLARLNEESSNLTSGVVLGTPSYMAPEQIRGILIDGRADLYACGVLLFELLTGTKPFRSANNEPLEVCMMHLNVPAPRLADKLPGHDFGALEAIVARALEKDREQRFATAGEFANALSAVVGRPNYQTPAVGATVQPAPASPPRTKEVSAFASAATSALLVEDVGSAATRALPADAAAPPTPSAPPQSVVQAVAPATPITPAPRARSRRGLVIGGAILSVVGIVVAVAATRGGGTGTPTTPLVAPLAVTDAGIASAPEVPVTDDPVVALIARADELVKTGRFKAGIDLLGKARRTYPKDARLPYHAGKLYLDKMYFADGFPLVRAAFELDPAYRSDPEIIKPLIRGFNATASYDGAIARFLRDDIGPAARPYLEETAKSHPNKIVRNRATAELRRY